jgi:uncharacterized protein YjdB/beta-glucanase (GH16 family)
MRTNRRRFLQSLLILVALVLTGQMYSQTPIWEDNFDGTSINKNVWSYNVSGGGMGNGELQYHTDRPENSYIESGNLVIEAKREDFETNKFTSARLHTLGRLSFQYGTIEARIKLPNLKEGLWPAFWMMGTNIGQIGWPKCGEFDILEAGSEAARLANKTNSLMTGAVHWWHETGTWGTWLQADASAEATLPSGNFYDAYHLYKMVWDSTHVEIWLDAIKVFDMGITAPEMSEFRQPNYIIMNLSVGGKNYVNLTDPALITAPLPAKMYVDYVRIYPIAGQTKIFYDNDDKKTGNYGIFSERSTITDRVNYTNDGHIYVWNNMATATGAAYEGSQVQNFNIAAGAWWGMGIFCDKNKNMARYSDGYLHLAMKTSAKDKIGIGVSSAAGESWVELIDGAEQYGLVRDGAWHEVNIPLNKLAIDFNTVVQPLMLRGDAPAATIALSIDDIYWRESVARPTPENGNFGVYTDNTSCVMKFNQPADGSFFIWEKTLNATTTTPKEGANVLSFTSAAGLAWFGASFTPNIKYNLTAFRYSNCTMHFDIKTTSTATFKIGMKSGNTPNLNQKWITFKNGADPYGLVRNGQWQSIDIPMSVFNNIELSEVSQLFELLGTEGAISDIAIDNIYFTNGGAAIKDGTVVPVTGVTLSSATLTLPVSATNQLTATVAPANATNKTVTWATSNAAVATVSTSGLVTAIAAGSATITVTTQDGLKTATCAVTVYVPVTSVSVSPTTATIAINATTQLTATVLPSNATNKNVTWSSNNTTIATVSATGLVTGKAIGSAIITVTTQDGAKTATSTITVNNVNVPVTSVTLSPTTATLALPGTQQLTPTVLPTNATNKNVTYASSNTAIATVSATGLVTAVAVGSATITVTTVDQAKTATCAITVGTGTNLALNKPVTVTSVENAGTPGSAAVDGNAGTRWASAFADPQSIMVDLQASYNINKVVLNWETAAGKSYTIQVSADGSTNWTTIYTTTTGAAGVSTLNVTGTGRYIRMSGTTRTTVYGYSLWEFEVYGTPNVIVPVTGVTMSPTAVSVAVNATSQLTATVAPSNATNKTVTWTTSNAAIATVSTTGLVTGKAAGSATITVTTQDGAKIATCAVTVPSTNIPVTGVTVSPTTASISIGGTTLLTAIVAPSNATNKTVTWTTSNAAIATVNSSGVVLGVAAGSATITVTTQDGAKTATCAVTVINNTTNIALNKPATSSSYEAAFVATGANDGSTATRWSSAFADPQWITIDLQASYAISKVVLNWETASGKAYQIQVSADNANWTNIYTTTTSTGGVQTLTVSGTGRYIRMYGTVRNTQWGYSLLEFEVYGLVAKSASEATSIAQNNSNSFMVYPNPVVNQLNLDLGENNSYTQIAIFDMTGKLVSISKIELGTTSINKDMSTLKSGAYILRLSGSNSNDAVRIIKK